MALDRVPYFVSQEGVGHSSEVVRSALYASLGGKEGVSGPKDLRVSAKSTPTGSVNVAPGSAIINSRYTGTSGQAYAARNATQTSVTINPTSSAGGRNDLVVLRIQDTAYEGSAPADVNNYDYTRLEVVQGVPSSTNSVKDLNLTYPAVALALIKIPASTSAITNAMINDLRNLANPRIQDVWYPMPTVTSEEETLTATSEIGEYFINAATQTIQIPDWAIRMQVRCEWLGVRYAAGNAHGSSWLEWGPYKAPSEREYATQKFQWDTPAATNVSRANWIVVDDVYIPAAMRGTPQLFVPKARRAGGVSNSVSLDGMSGMSVQIRFLETRDDDLLQG
ncbi:hypothetical protein [Glutamicibacter sp. TV12E]|uniref:hypothetical protein n=1 Tax=Glutamicibacter sp. TV12E TaxID=3446362 RepID=UPI00403346CB